MVRRRKLTRAGAGGDSPQADVERQPSFTDDPDDVHDDGNGSVIVTRFSLFNDG